MVDVYREEAGARLWRALRDQVNEFRFYPVGHEKPVQDVIQKNDLQTRVSLAAGRRREGRVERMDIVGAAPLFIHTPSCFRKDLVKAVEGL